MRGQVERGPVQNARSLNKIPIVRLFGMVDVYLVLQASRCPSGPVYAAKEDYDEWRTARKRLAIIDADAVQKKVWNATTRENPTSRHPGWTQFKGPSQHGAQSWLTLLLAGTFGDACLPAALTTAGVTDLVKCEFCEHMVPRTEHRTRRDVDIHSVLGRDAHMTEPKEYKGKVSAIDLEKRILTMPGRAGRDPPIKWVTDAQQEFFVKQKRDIISR